MTVLRSILGRALLAWLLCGSVFGQIPAGENIVRELGCASCHSDLNLPSNLRERTPDLSSAGLRYNSAWLFEFLQRPSKIRHHIGNARMPSFHLSEGEALALTLFLETQKTIPGSWPIGANPREGRKLSSSDCSSRGRNQICAR
jgi:hypothetical protein